jgi:hypothetical protein
MSSNADKSSVRWHPDQEKLFLELLSLPQYKRIGRDSDGMMGRKVETVWEPLLQRFSSTNEGLRAGQTSTGLQMKTDFTAKALRQKFTLMSCKYKELKKACKVGRHELRGETGSTASGQATTPQEAIDQATKKWPLFSAWHATFGEVQRLRDDTYTETQSPLKPVGSLPSGPPGVEESAVRRAEQWRELKRQRSISTERGSLSLDVGNGDPNGVTPKASAVGTELLAHNGAGSSGGRATCAEATDKQGSGQKRQRMSSRDVQLGKVFQTAAWGSP